jgi:Fe-S-cluster containining protein
MKVKNITEDETVYFKLHGCEIKGDERMAHVLMPTPCTKLSDDFSCTAYEARPMICKRYARTHNETFFSPECTLFWKEVTGREAQVAIMKAKHGDPTILL